MSIKLYYSAYTRAMRVAFLLEELGVPYTRVALDRSKAENKTPEYLAIHPHGLVPALQDGDTTVFETAAICLYLADKYPDKGLAPVVGSPERGAYYQWIVYAVATLEPAISDVYLQGELPADQRDAAVLTAARGRVQASAEVLSRALEGRAFLLGDTFTAADVLVGAMSIWAEGLGLLDGHPTLVAYAARVRARPAYARS